MNIEISECPKVLQDSVLNWRERMPYSKLIAVRKNESTPYKDKTIIQTSYKAYFQFGYEFMIISTSETKGMDSPLDGEISTNMFNGGDLMAIVDHADYVKDDLRRRLLE